MMLPITNYKKEIIEAVRNHSFTIVSAETGSGKSTQISQYLAEYYSKIVVTEPRIMAAKTLAKRVTEEMGVTLGEDVGYMTAYDKCYSKGSNILYCTDGLQLIRTIFSDDTETENVLIIDEVHEWNLNIETLIAWCKFMQGKWNTKVVIMSATLDVTGLANFFGEDVATLTIPGTLYDVEVEERHEEALISTIKENINQRKNILVFVAGKKEISTVMEELAGEDATVLPLHGEMDWDDQKKCFEHYSNPKVIVATNVAQTSLTIPDIDVVVDTGEARISVAENGIQGLFLKYISRSDIMQRKGRAGRTKEGKYILCSNARIEDREEFSVPEIQRSILDRVVLQMAAIGLDAEELKFYHQPDMISIKEAKWELTAIGALSDNKITQLGHKIVKMPVSVQFARMIVEAEKYGVTEQVMTIAAIIEMGGLLAKEGHYSDFTVEYESDLLAELDVWNSINKKGYIDFQKLGIKKKSFFKIKEHIKKLRETLYGIVEMKHNDNRKAIVKSCLSGLVSHIYVRDEYGNLRGEDRTTIQQDRKSCLEGWAKIVVGIPRTIEYKNRYGFTSSLNLVGFASEIDVKTLFELVPDAIETKTKLRYSNLKDAVEVTITRSFAGVVVDTEINYDANHPAYTELKERYEEEVQNYNRWATHGSVERQEVVIIDGKQFRVHYNLFDNKPIVYIDNETLFRTGEKEIILDSGEKVRFKSDILWNREETNLIALRNAVEMQRINRIRERKKQEYEQLKANTLDDIIANARKIGKIQLTMNNGGYGDTPILVHGCISLKKNTVTFSFTDDEELANSNTLEALQYLFIKEIEKNYGENKFSHQQGKKKKILTDSEREAKNDFDSLVREVLPNLSIENITENLEFLEEYYQDLMK